MAPPITRQRQATRRGGHARALLALCFAMACGAQAADTPNNTVYRWVDDQGKLHFSDEVPEQYKAKAKRVEANVRTPTPEERRLAEERAARDKATAQALAQARLAQAAKAASAVSLGASQPSTNKRPPAAPTEQTDCRTWQRLFDESQACFGEYRTVRGTTRVDANEQCTVVPDLPERCKR